MAYQVDNSQIKRKTGRRHSLSHPQLRKIRYKLRTVLYLKYKEEQQKVSSKISEINNNKSLSYNDQKRKVKKLNLKRENLNVMTHFYPIACAVCADRTKDLIFRPQQGGYICDDANKM
jgi:hypothetical protein